MKPAIRTKMTKFGIGLALAMLSCGGALAQDVSYNSMPGVDFSKYHTYKWVLIEGAKQPNQIVDAQIKQAVNRAKTIDKHPPTHSSHGRVLRPGFPAEHSSSTYPVHANSCSDSPLPFLSSRTSPTPPTSSCRIRRSAGLA